jgi:hypothetical protein
LCSLSLVDVRRNGKNKDRCGGPNSLKIKSYSFFIHTFHTY